VSDRDCRRETMQVLFSKILVSNFERRLACPVLLAKSVFIVTEREREREYQSERTGTSQLSSYTYEDGVLQVHLIIDLPICAKFCRLEVCAL
jgi:hypothetical protein